MSNDSHVFRVVRQTQHAGVKVELLFGFEVRFSVHSAIVVGNFKSHDFHLVGEGDTSRPFSRPLPLCVLLYTCISRFG